jgi:sugar phosphate isomerase/epimerase
MIKLCLLASSPDILELNFLVRVLTGDPEELGRLALTWGYDGIEYMPNPERIPDPAAFTAALEKTGAIMPVLNSGRISAQGMSLLNEDKAISKRAIESFKRILDLAGYCKARVGLGMARGTGISTKSKEENEKIAFEIFLELAEYADKVGTSIMLEPSETKYTILFNTNSEVRMMVEKINKPCFTSMLDTHQLWGAEPSIEQGIRDAKGKAKHIHLFEPSRLPPGLNLEEEILDWPHIAWVLKSEGFEGSASVCLVPKGDPESMARKTAAFLKKLFNW